MSAIGASVTLEEVFSVVLARRVPLAPELAGYLVLEIAERADPNGGDVDPRSVFVGEEGTVALVKPRRDGPVSGAGSGNAEASIRTALAQLLEASGSQTPALAAASKRKPGPGLPALAEELEAALIPVNRAAGRRALARLAREVKRVTLGVGRHVSSTPAPPAPAPSVEARSLPPPSVPPPPRAPASATFAREEEPTTAQTEIPSEILRQATPEPHDASELPTTQFEPRGPSSSETDVDDLIAQFGVSEGGEHQHARDLKAMAGLEPTPPPSRGGRRGEGDVRRPDRREGADANTDVEALLAMSTNGSSRPRVERPFTALRAAPAFGREMDDRQLPTQPSSLRKARATLPSASLIRGRRSSRTVAVVVGVAVVGGGGYAAWRLRPPTGNDSAPAPSVVGARPANSQVVAAACKATLVVSDVPVHAEVLLGKGQAPAEVDLMPVGARLEFVATAEGFAPKRVVVPAGAGWETGANGKPRYEVAVQLDKSRARPGANDPWPAAEPGSEVGGQGPPGTVRVVATPRGAEVWMLAGIGPEARVEQLPCGREVDVLLAGPTTYRKRIHVSAGDFVVDDAPSGPAAKVPTRVAHVSGK
jgi:hypothetical protein